MMTAKDSWLGKPSDWDAPNVDHMGSVLPSTKQRFAASGFNPITFSANAPLPEFSSAGLHGSYGISGGLPPLMESSLFPLDPYIKDSESEFAHKLGVETMANNVTSSNWRNYVICDQSDNLVRFFLSSFGPATGKFIDLPMKPVQLGCTRDVQQIPKNEQTISTNPKIQGASDDSRVVVEESEFREDSEELNALLYSDDEYDYNYGEQDCDGEVTSTYGSPSKVEENLHNYEQVCDDMIEEVATSYGSTKRQRLPDGGYKKSLVVEHPNSGENDRSRENNSDMESSSACPSGIGNNMSSNSHVKRSKKDKIHETLKIIENIIPGLKSKEPTLIIDEAINYLNSLKLKAKALGLAYP